MTDYRIEAKIRNARILKALEEIGETPTGFAKKRNLNFGRMCKIVAMKIPATNSKGEWWPEVTALCEATNKIPQDLLTLRQMEGIGKTKTSVDVKEDMLEISAEQVQRELLPSPEDRHDAIMIATELMDHMRSVYPREAKAVSMRNDGCTLEEIAKELGVTRERIRQMTEKGYRCMRDYARCKWGIRKPQHVKDLFG